MEKKVMIWTVLEGSLSLDVGCGLSITGKKKCCKKSEWEQTSEVEVGRKESD